jgi:hypothetical protein
MDETTKQPKVFANKVIRQIITHMVAEDMIISPEDYMQIRVVFRNCGGSWDQLGLGDIHQVELLKTIITSWGQMPGRKKESDQLV